jgi:hypothetical protein
MYCRYSALSREASDVRESYLEALLRYCGLLASCTHLSDPVKLRYRIRRQVMRFNSRQELVRFAGRGMNERTMQLD